jgi:nucleoside-diphosphate-sugar epimerase
MKIVITGPYGFVGTNLSAHLSARGHELIAVHVARKNSKANSGFFTWNDLAPIDWPAVDAVVHLAGKAHDTRNVADPQSYFDVNVGLTRKIVDAFVAHGPQATKAFVLFSSVKAIADRVNGVLREDDPPAPQTPYGRSKLAAEAVVQAAFGTSESTARATFALNTGPNTRRFPAIVLLLIGCLPPMELHLIKAPENRGPPQTLTKYG